MSLDAEQLRGAEGNPFEKRTITVSMNGVPSPLTYQLEAKTHVGKRELALTVQCEAQPDYVMVNAVEYRPQIEEKTQTTLLQWKGRPLHLLSKQELLTALGWCIEREVRRHHEFLDNVSIYTLRGK